MIFSVVPAGVRPPVSSMSQATSITLAWRAPDSPNGVIIAYEVYRFQSSAVLVYNGTLLSATDTGLQPGTFYTYALRARTLAGATQSASAFIRTLDSAPTGLSAPLIGNITQTSVAVAWSKPTRENGVILYYSVSANGGEQYRGTGFSASLVQLTPFTSYNITLLACTAGGCTVSWSSTTTLPAGMWSFFFLLCLSSQR